MKKLVRFVVAMFASAAYLAGPVQAQELIGGHPPGVSGRYGQPVPAGDSRPEIGFSPEGSAYPLVMRVIDSAHRSLHVMAYEMKDAGIVRALSEKAARGVDVVVEVDYRENLGEGSSDFTRKRLSSLAASGVRVCVISEFPIFHDKVMIADGRAVEFGSFNYTRSAKERNSENAAVFWNNPEIASTYESHFQSRLAYCQWYHG